MRNIGKTRIALARLLEEKLRASESLPLLSIEPEDLWIQEGAYRNSNWDLARWGCDVRFSGKYFKVYSWDTMTECVKKGIEVMPPSGSKDHFEREISSK